MYWSRKWTLKISYPGPLPSHEGLRNARRKQKYSSEDFLRDVVEVAYVVGLEVEEVEESGTAGAGLVVVARGGNDF
jgi:hypothetical protein